MAEIQPTRHQTRSGLLYFIRTAYGKDAPRVLEAAQRVVAESVYSVITPDEMSRVSVEEEIEFLEGFRKDPHRLFLVAETADKRIAGSLDFAPGQHLRLRHTGELGMGVIREFQGEGIGSALLSELIEWAIETGMIERIQLTVLAENTRAVALYRKFGFEEEGRRKREIKFDEFRYGDSILMAKILRADP